jgi:hypothetical protein
MTETEEKKTGKPVGLGAVEAIVQTLGSMQAAHLTRKLDQMLSQHQDVRLLYDFVNRSWKGDGTQVASSLRELIESRHNDTEKPSFLLGARCVLLSWVQEVHYAAGGVLPMTWWWEHQHIVDKFLVIACVLESQYATLILKTKLEPEAIPPCVVFVRHRLETMRSKFEIKSKEHAACIKEHYTKLMF